MGLLAKEAFLLFGFVGDAVFAEVAQGGVDGVDAIGDAAEGFVEFGVGLEEDFAAGAVEFVGGLHQVVFEDLGGFLHLPRGLVEVVEEGLVSAGERADKLGETVGLLEDFLVAGGFAVVEFWEELLGADGVDDGEGLVLFLHHGGEGEVEEEGQDES